MFIHDFITTNDRQAKIQWSATNNCQHCGQIDTLIHRLIERSEGADIWRWTRSRRAIILRMDPKYILPEWKSVRVFTFGYHRGTGQFCGSSPTWNITVHNTGTEYRPSTTLISWGVPDGKHIKQLAGAKRLGFTWRYYNPRHITWRNCVPSSCRMSHSTIPARTPPTDDVATITAFS